MTEHHGSKTLTASFASSRFNESVLKHLHTAITNGDFQVGKKCLKLLCARRRLCVNDTTASVHYLNPLYYRFNVRNAFCCF